MENTITCHNGHIYAESYESCPYCPKGSDEDIETELDNMKTQKLDSESEKTVVLNDSRSDKTAIHKPSLSSEKEASQGSRKLVGWLISYTWNKEGQDYQLREGKTTIGADNNSDVCLTDSEVSANHATILYRGGKFRIKDEFTTNGTIINGKEIEGQAVLNDGDIINVGKTDLKIRII